MDTINANHNFVWLWLVVQCFISLLNLGYEQGTYLVYLILFW
ncbi:MAG: hypothetical protein K0R14_514 [Burkholderiales bacterium]|nr:hypothetical protein [Burkholderiales bacterium]